MLRLTICVSLLMTTLVLVSSCVDILDVGRNTIIDESFNSQASKKAILFLKEGNATLDESMQVLVAGYDYELKPKDVGNTFTVDSDHNATLQDSSSINFTWLANDTLRIDYDKKLRTFVQEKKVDGVTILYEPR